MDRRQVLVIGGGIGGLTAAVALQRAGIAVQVHERAPEVREVGAGIGLWPNAIVALDRIGLGEAVRRAGVPLANGIVRSSAGKTIALTSLAELERRFGASTIIVHRATLIEILRAALGEEDLRLGRACVGVEQTDAGVTARFADGGTASADVIVGADGLHSVVRSALHGEVPPVYAGYTAWRAAVPFDHGRFDAGESWGPGTRFGMFPMVGGQVYWFATANAREGARASGGEKAFLLDRFAKYHDPVPAMIDAAPADAILRNDVYDRPPLADWGRGRITLLGDAAHPTTPNLGQGACQAIEDAVVLARRLHDARDVVQALRAYERERAPRTNKIVLRSRQFGRIAQIESAPLIALRNAALSAVPARVRFREVEWLARFE